MSDLQWPNAGRRTRIEPARLLPSPAFAVSYPRIRNPELIPAPSLKAMEMSWNKGTFPASDIEVFDIKGAYVIGECLVLDHQFQVIENASDTHHSEAEISRAIETIKREEASHLVPHYDRPGIVVKRRNPNNYGHFLVEMLPMAVFGRIAADSPEVRYVSHPGLAASMDTVLRAFRLLGVPLRQVLMPSWLEPVWFDRLIVVRGLSEHGRFMSPLALVGSDRLGQILAGGGGLPDRRYERIFVRRVPIGGTGRIMHNETEVAQRLAALGFAEIEPGSMALEEQIRAFASARHVIGVGGAAMTNIAFCRPGTKITVLWPPAFPDTFFWFIATHKELDYLEIRGEQTGDDASNPWSAGFILREGDIQYLEQVRTQVA
jgi:capsular polysaccharide biosynthesis protein